MDDHEKHRLKNAAIFLTLVLFLAAIFVTLLFISPEEIVKKVGVHNSYLILFFVSFFGGFSGFGAASFMATLITFAVSGLNPYILGIIAGTSLAMGDLLMFYIGRKGKHALHKKIVKRIDKFAHKFTKKTVKFIPFIVFIYIAFIPLPNDLIIIFIALMHYPYKKVLLPIVAGDFVYSILLAVLASKGMVLF